MQAETVPLKANATYRIVIFVPFVADRLCALGGYRRENDASLTTI